MRVEPVDNGLLGKFCHQVVIFQVVDETLPVGDPEMAGDKDIPVQA